MPFDPYFKSSWKKEGTEEWRQKKIVAAKHKRSWPEGSQFKPKAKPIDTEHGSYKLGRSHP